MNVDSGVGYMMVKIHKEGEKFGEIFTPKESDWS